MVICKEYFLSYSERTISSQGRFQTPDLIMALQLRKQAIYNEVLQVYWETAELILSQGKNSNFLSLEDTKLIQAFQNLRSMVQ
jgi:hypothetical protein